MDITQTPDEAPEQKAATDQVQALEDADAAAAPDLADELARRLTELLEGGSPQQP